MEKRNGIIIDTDILIKIYRGSAYHKDVLENLTSKFIISCVTEMELLVGCKNQVMQRDIENNLQSFEIQPINEQIVSIAKELIKKYSFSHKISIPDNLIAATSIYHSLDLYTDNLKHFTFIEELPLFVPGNK